MTASCGTLNSHREYPIQWNIKDKTVRIISPVTVVYPTAADFGY